MIFLQIITKLKKHVFHNIPIIFSVIIIFIIFSSKNGEELRRPLDICQEQDDLLRLLHIIKPNIFIQMLASMLLERKLILLSKSIR